MRFACQNIELMRTRLRMCITCDFISSHVIKHVFRIAKSLMRIFLHHMRIFYFFACEYSLTVACDEIIVVCEKLFIACDLWEKKNACAIEISHAIFVSRMRVFFRAYDVLACGAHAKNLPLLMTGFHRDCVNVLRIPPRL